MWGMDNITKGMDKPRPVIPVTHGPRHRDHTLCVFLGLFTLHCIPQISKRLLIITPYLGVGMTMGRSKVSGGAYTEVQGVTEQEWSQITQALQTLGEEVPQLTKEGFTITNRQGGFATRIYGGTSLNLFFLKFDVTGFYELLSQSLGLSAALRLQF